MKSLLPQLLDLRSLDHAPVPHKGHFRLPAPKALGDLLDLGAQGFGIAGVAGEDLDG